MQKQINGKIVFSRNDVRTIRHQYGEKKGGDLNLNITAYTKISSKWIMYKNVKPKTIKFWMKKEEKIIVSWVYTESC